MKKYFLRITATYSAKNQPQKKLLSVFSKFDNTLIHGDKGLDILITAIVEVLDKVNQQNHRCKDLLLDLSYNHDDERCYAIYAPGHTLIQFFIYPVKNVVEN